MKLQQQNLCSRQTLERWLEERKEREREREREKEKEKERERERAVTYLMGWPTGTQNLTGDKRTDGWTSLHLQSDQISSRIFPDAKCTL
jgi:hypothetical protein